MLALIAEDFLRVLRHPRFVAHLGGMLFGYVFLKIPRMRGFDPVANENARRELGPGPVILEDMYEVAKGADALVICTDWDEFKSPDFGAIKTLLKQPVVFDGRNLFAPAQMKQNGFPYYSIGRR